MITIRFGYVSPTGKGYKYCQWVTDPIEAYKMALNECKGRSIYISYNRRAYHEISLEYLETLARFETNYKGI